MKSGGLPWLAERDQPPKGTGICLSGGGLRAAYFGLGVIQRLQARRGLLFGPQCAEHLSVVSGGSYVASTFALNASARASGDISEEHADPLSPNSPEASHVLTRGRYLVEDGWAMTLWRFGWRGAMNLLSLLALFIWSGVMLADLALVTLYVDWDWLQPPGERGWQWMLAALCLLGGAVILRGVYKDGGWDRYLLPLIGAALVFATCTSLVSIFDLMSEWWGAIGWWWIAIAIALLTIVGLTTFLSMITARRSATKVASWTFGEIAVAVPRFVGIVLLSVSASALYSELERGVASNDEHDQMVAVIVFFAALIVGLLFSYASNRVSLHGLYRDLLSRCFAVRRQQAGVAELSPATAASLSEVAPPPRGTQHSFPRLLVSATANIVWRDPSGVRRKFAPFVLSFDCCGVPSAPWISIETEKLELGRVASGLVGSKEPLLSLMTAVATTGAAISPSMGRMTMPAVRPLIASLNLRLGRWLPNPWSARMRTEVATHQSPWDATKPTSLGPGWDEFVPELFGLNRSDARRVYVSDGGHYDNLGLLTLFWARCEEIWCVDSQADKAGRAKQIREAITFARDEIGVTTDIDLDQFRVVDGLSSAAFAQGTVTYPGGRQGRLIVVKLGLTSSSPAQLLEYKMSDHRFPHHPTFIQWYGSDRADAYRRLGEANAEAALLKMAVARA